VRSVVHRARRMILRNIEGREIVEVILNLRPNGNVKSGATEQRLDAQPRLSNGVQPAALLTAAGKGHIDAAGNELAINLPGLKLDAPRFKRRLHALFRRVDCLARRGARGGRKRAQQFQRGRELTLLAEPAHAHRVEPGKVRARCHFRECPGDKIRRIVHGNAVPIR
jgi:hypothetical protein